MKNYSEKSWLSGAIEVVTLHEFSDSHGVIIRLNRGFFSDGSFIYQVVKLNKYNTSEKFFHHYASLSDADAKFMYLVNSILVF